MAAVSSKALLESYFDYTKVGGFVLKEWENAVDVTLRKIVTSESFFATRTDKEGKFKASITNYEVRASGNYPTTANRFATVRRKQESYMADIFVSIILTEIETNKPVHTIDNHHLFSIPLMIGTKYCELNGVKSLETLSMNQCPIDPTGYFFINGKEKYANMKRRLCTGKAILSDDTGKTLRESNRNAKSKVSIQSPRLSVVCTMTCERTAGTSKVTVRERIDPGNDRVILADLNLKLGKDGEIDPDDPEPKIPLKTSINVFLPLDLFAYEESNKIDEEIQTIIFDKSKRSKRNEYINTFIDRVEESNQVIMKSNLVVTKSQRKDERDKNNILYSRLSEKQANSDNAYSYYNKLVNERNDYRRKNDISPTEDLVSEFKTSPEYKQLVDFAIKSVVTEERAPFYLFKKVKFTEKLARIRKCVDSHFVLPEKYRSSYNSYIDATSRDYREMYSNIKKNGNIFDVIRTTNEADYDKQPEEIILLRVLEQFFPVPMMEISDNIGRFFSLLSMVNNLIEYFVGYRPIDDKNSFNITQIDAGGKNMCGLIIGPYWRHRMDSYASNPPTIEDFKIHMSFITSDLIKKFSTGKWNMSQNKNDDILISEDLKRESINSAFFAITRIITKSNDEGIQSDVRFQNGSHNRRICSFHTPDNGKAGLVTYAAVSVVTSFNKTTEVVIKAIEELLGKTRNEFIFSARQSDSFFKFLVNSKFLGWIDSDDAFYQQIRSIKHDKRYFDISFRRNSKYCTVEIYSDYGRFVTPLLVVNQKTGIPKIVEQIPDEEDRTIENMLSEGCIEFIDSAEEEEFVVAPEPEMLAETNVSYEEYLDLLKEREKVINSIRHHPYNSNRKLEDLLEESRKIWSSIDSYQALLDRCSLYSEDKILLQRTRNKVAEYNDDTIWKNNIAVLSSYTKNVPKAKKEEFLKVIVDIILLGNTKNEDAWKDTMEIMSKEFINSFEVGEGIKASLMATTFTDKERDEILSKVIRMATSVSLVFPSSYLPIILGIIKALKYQYSGLHSIDNITIKIFDNPAAMKDIKDQIKTLQASIKDSEDLKKENVEYHRDIKFLKDQHKELSRRILLYDRYKFYKRPAFIDTHGSSPKNDVNEITHSELNPTMIFGVSENLIPFANHNPATRSSYQCAQNNQLSSFLALNEAYRFDTSCNKVLSAKPPTITTALGNILKINQLAQHSEILIAFMLYANNQEDGSIFNRAAIDRGLFYTFNIKTVSATYEANTTIMFPKEIRENEVEAYRNIDRNTGYIKEKSSVNRGDVLVCFCTRERGNDRYFTYKAKVDDVGIVERVELVNMTNKKAVLIKLRKINIPQLGDKFELNPALKATLNYIYPSQDMPFDDQGRQPCNCFACVCYGSYYCWRIPSTNTRNLYYSYGYYC